MSENITVREAVSEDYKRICEITRLSLGYDYPEEETLKRLKAILSRPTDKIFVAIYGNELIGYAHASDYECLYSESLKNLMALAVDNKYQGIGAGRRLLEEVEAWAKKCGCSGVRLSSGFERKDAHKFYLHCGYTVKKDHKTFNKYFSA